MADLRQGPTVPEPGSYDDPNSDQERKRAAEASLRADRLKDTQRAILGTPKGREWLWALLSSMHTFEQRVAMSGSDYENGFWTGERESGIRLLRALTHDSPEDFAKMFKEQDVL